MFNIKNSSIILTLVIIQLKARDLELCIKRISLDKMSHVNILNTGLTPALQKIEFFHHNIFLRMQNLKCVSRTNVREALVRKGDKKVLLFIPYINQVISRQNFLFLM